MSVSKIPYRSIIDALPVPCALNDEFGNITFLNKAFIQSLGYTLEDVHNISDWWPRAYPDPAYRQWVTEAWSKILATMPTSGSTQSMEATIRTKDGRDAIMNVSACPLEGAPVGVHVVMFQDVTSQKSAEAKSLELRERLERTEKIANVGGWEYDLETRQTVWTPGTFLIHDVDPSSDDEPARHAAQILARLPPEAADAFAAAIQEGRVFDGEYPALTAKGRKIWLHLRGQGVWRDGKVVRIVGHTQDITVRKAAEEKSADLLRRLERTEALAKVGGWEADLKTGATTWTPGTYIIHDLDPSDDPLVLQAYISCMNATLPREAARALQTAAAQGTSCDIELPVTTATGRKIWVHTRAQPVMRDGEAVALMGHTQDITARKAAEEIGAELLQRLERTEQIARVGGWEYNPATGKSNWTIGNYLIHDLDPNGPPDFFDTYVRKMRAEISPTHTASFQTALERGTPYDLIFPCVTALGRKIWLHSRGEPVQRGGKVVSIFGHSQDITARKNAEDQLRAAQKMEAVGQLTAGIAHDFNNLLAVIMANLELLEEAVADQPLLARRVEAALKASDRGAELTQHLLAFGRNQALTPQLYDLCDRLKHSVRLLTRTLPGHIEIEIESAPRPIWVRVDEAQLENALLNMGLNARDAMPNGGTLRFSVSTSDVPADPSKDIRPGRYATISIQDTGVGMSPEVMERIFDPFFTTKPTGQGSGMGLSMVHGFVHQSKGHMHVASRLGAGTTFTLLFPLEESPAAEAFIQAHAATDSL